MAIKVALFLALAALVGQSMACGLTCNSLSNGIFGGNCGLGNYYGNNLYGSNFFGGFNNCGLNSCGFNGFGFGGFNGPFGYPGFSTCASTIVPGSTCFTKCVPNPAIVTSCVSNPVC